ncbi:hypothetical protein MTR67_006678 [Solanum verrucosum]|uniref:Uncharacterized protein n=1 Tax=Solanum verrucosum TaxID=315347 RepID=A0AAF0PYS1_SOLVR|nr:hypothetical protein MTR67_006678 [Solanum verrucosum]
MEVLMGTNRANRRYKGQTPFSARTSNSYIQGR